MPVAYLILAHNCPNHFARLKDALLEQRGAQLFIHIDGKSDIGPFREAAPEARASFIDDRFVVAWGDFSVVQATLALMSAAHHSQRDFSHFCLLSGTDYPIRSPDYISEFFHLNRDVEFMNLVGMPAEHLNKPLSRLTRFRLPAAVPRPLRKPAQRLLDRVVKRDYQRHMPGMKPFAGSQWWALTAEACDYALAFASNHPSYVSFFRHVIVPDESFFQTIIGNSPFASRVRKNLTQTWWTSGASSPSVLDREHVLSLRGTEPVIVGGPYGSGEAIFARKFPDDSAELVNLLKT